MPVTVGEILGIIDRLAPAALAEEWDNVGLQLGGRHDEAEAVLLSLNVNREVLEEAQSRGCGIILTHHPLIFRPLASVSDDLETGRLIRAASREGIAIIAAHTNLDAARGGLADMLADLIGLQQPAPLDAAPSGWSKLVVFVPTAELDTVRERLFGAGAGVIGDYLHCSYMLEGTGTFLPGEGADPTIGTVGKDERVDETRLEMVFPSSREEEIVAALLAAHSYEEPAYDIYPLATKSRHEGSGRVGELPEEAPLAGFAASLAEIFGLEQVAYSGDPDRPVRRVAVVPGSGASYLRAASASADVLVTGDFSYHDTILAAELGLALVDVPHDVSEQAALENWLPRLEHELEPTGAKAFMSHTATGLWMAAAARGKSTIPEDEEKSMHHLHVDGGSRGNPGPAGIGVVLTGPEGTTVDTLADYIGEATNNMAEYQAMISGLELALDRGITRLAIFSDSELIVRQLQGAYRVKNEGLRPYYQEAKSLLSRLDEYEIQSIPREANAHADELVNKALDEAGH